MTGTKEHEALRSDALIMSVVKLGDSVRGGKEVKGPRHYVKLLCVKSFLANKLSFCALGFDV